MDLQTEFESRIQVGLVLKCLLLCAVKGIHHEHVFHRHECMGVTASIFNLTD
jgi:hypothetical protein